MYVVAIHDISDSERFFGAISSTPIPEGIKLLHALPKDDGSKAVCLWEADAIQPVQELVESTVGDVSENELFEVDAANAQGLPAS